MHYFVAVAIQCLSEAYGVDLASASHSTKYDIKPTLEVRMEGRAVGTVGRGGGEWEHM